MIETDIAIVGAGAAGLAAAAAVRGAGRRCVVLEALPRLGGRAHTIMLGADAFDTGAFWLHAAERNPLTPIARAAGLVLRDTAVEMSWQTFVDGRPANEAEREDHARTEAAVETIGAAAAEAARDLSFADAMAPLADHPWLATIEMFEATLIAAADARELSVRDWHANALDGANLSPSGGLGTFVSKNLAIEVQRDTPVRRIERGRPVRLHTPRGTLQAEAAIVTVSTGVLRDGGIAFDPPLPATHLAALDGLPMGLLDKFALTTVGGDRLGLPDSCGVQRRLPRRHEPSMSVIAWPFGAAHLVGFVGGRTAWDLTRQTEAERAAFARDELGRIMGRDLGDRLRVPVATSWGTDPRFLGSYAYARVGHADARARLAEPLDDGRLIFAGEATAPDGLAGTVGGAWRAGTAAAAQALRILVG